jgi:hypothetical protein
MKPGDIGTGVEVDSQLRFVSRFMIVLCDTFSNLTSGDSDYRVQVGVIVRVAAKDFDSEDALFQVIGFAVERLFDNELKQIGVSPAIVKEVIVEDELQLSANGIAVL